MTALVCEFCGGKLMGRPGGVFECDSCGMEYDTAWAKAKIQEIKGTVQVEGTVEVTGTVKLDGPVEIKGGPSKESFVKRAKMKMEDELAPTPSSHFSQSESQPIKALLEQALEIDPEYDEALLCMAFLDYGCRTPEEFREKYVLAQRESNSFKRFCKFAKGDLAIWAEDVQREFVAESERREQERLLQKEQVRIRKEKRIQNLRLIREKIAPAQGLISTGSSHRVGSHYHTVGLKSDGTVIAAGDNAWGQCNVADWTDIVAISTDGYHIVGLKSNGTVVAVGLNGKGQCNVAGWTDIVAISTASDHTVGLKSDGTVVAVGDNSDGRCNVAGWTDIVDISTDSDRTVGLKSDGTVVAVGENLFGRCSFDGWTDIVAISTGHDYTVGLKADGTVVSDGYDSWRQGEVEAWKNIVAISIGSDHTVGLKADGTVVARGYNLDGRCNVAGWTDIVAISAGSRHTVGLKADGTVVAVGDNDKGRCNVDGWKLFSHVDTLEQEREEAMLRRAEQERIEAERRAEQERAAEQKRAAHKAVLEREKAQLTAELQSLKGLFSGKRRKEIETRIAQIDAELGGL